MYNKLVLVLINILFVAYCYRPNCDIWCCRRKQEYKEKEREKELCKIKCYIRSRRSLDDDITSPYIGGYSLRLHLGGDSLSHLGHPSPKPPEKVLTTKEKENKIIKCLSECPKLEEKTFSCSDECCRYAEKIHSIRNGTTTYQCAARCCNGRYTTVTEIYNAIKSNNKTNFIEEIVDCRKVGKECDGEEGYMLTFANLTTVCLLPNENSNIIGSYFDRQDECGDLQIGEVTLQSGISYPLPINNYRSINPYGYPRSTKGFCKKFNDKD